MDSTLVFNSYGDHGQEGRNIQAALDHRANGIIGEPIDWQRLALKVAVDPRADHWPLGDDQTTLMPYDEATYSLPRELIKRRHIKIACLLSLGRRARRFLHRYRCCLFDHSLEYQADMVLSAIGDDLTRVLESRPITRVLAFHCHRVPDFLQFAQSMQYRLPQDLSLVFFMNDNKEHLRYPGSPEISSYIMRNADFGAYLCRRVIHAIKHESQPSETFTHDLALDGKQTIGQPPSQQCRRIVVVGSINMDTYLTAPNLPKAGVTTTIRDFASTLGSKATNQAMGVAQLRHEVSLIGNVGSDPTADYIYKAMRGSGGCARRKQGHERGHWQGPHLRRQ